MTKLPSISYNELIKTLKSAGFEYAPKRGKGSHIALVKIEAERTLLVIIPRKNIIPKGTRSKFSVPSIGATTSRFINFLPKNLLRWQKKSM